MDRQRGPHDRRIGARHPRTREGLASHKERAIDATDLVPVEPFRDRFVYLRDHKQITTSQLCWHMGWTYRLGEQAARREQRRGHKPDTTHALRTLGLRRRPCGHEQQFVTYDVAERLCRALGMDPYEAGI